MELSRQKLRQQTLNRFKYIRTCVLARELCLLVRTNRVAFNLKDAQACCTHVATLCKEAGCIEQSNLCERAAKELLKSEEKYLELCQESCKKCGQFRHPQPKKTSYVA